MSESRRAMPESGERVVLTVEVDRFPHVLVPAGMGGTVEYADEGKILIRLDEQVPGLAEWDNCLVWADGLETEEGQTVAEAFWEAVEPASPAPAP